MSSTKIQDTVIESLDASKLTGTFGAIDGSNLTNLPVTGEVIIKDTVNPEENSNPATGVGTLWLNTQDGEMYCCTDATTDANVWKTVSTSSSSGGSGSPAPANESFVMGVSDGYMSGGENDATGIDVHKVSFSSDGDAVDHGDLTEARNAVCGSSSGTHGYMMGGYKPGYPSSASTRVDKFAFASNAFGTQVSNLPWGDFNCAGHSSWAENKSFMSGGSYYGHAVLSWGHATDNSIGHPLNLSGTKNEHAGTSSSTHGYLAGGNPNNGMQKFQFASGYTVTAGIGNLQTYVQEMGSSNSTDWGYTHAGHDGSWNNTATIQKHSFTSDGTVGFVGNLSEPKNASGGFSSTTYGYCGGGKPAAGGHTDRIEKYPFASDSDASTVGVLMNQLQHLPAGNQV